MTRSDAIQNYVAARADMDAAKREIRAGLITRAEYEKIKQSCKEAKAALRTTS